MAAEEVEGIVLARHRFSETSWTLRAFTRERGRLDLLAKGARRPKSPLYGHLDLYNREALLVYERRGELDLLADSYVFDEHLGLRSRPEAFAGAGMLAEVARFGFEARDPHPEAYATLAWAMKSLSAPFEAGACFRGAETKTAMDMAKAGGAPAPGPSAVTAAALWSLSASMGYTPRLSVCVSCGKSASASASMSASAKSAARFGGALSWVRGGWVCRACARRGDAVLSARDEGVLRRWVAGSGGGPLRGGGDLSLAAAGFSGAGLGLASALAEYLGRLSGRAMNSVRVWRSLAAGGGGGGGGGGSSSGGGGGKSG